MPQARTIAEVIAGEAVSGTREQRYADMLGIASVISNRSTITGVPADSIVSAPNQFDAYGKSLPKGTSAYTGLAQQAWDQVQTTGPVHPGTYYATPSATKNLPKGLAPVTATTGHQYFVDPAARAIRTAVGTIKPSVEAVAGLVQNTIGAVGDAVGSLLPDSAPAPTARPSVGVPGGMAALAPNGLNYDFAGARRNQVPTSGIGLKVADVASSVMPGISTRMFSGMEPTGTAPVGARNRHPLGFAGDFTFRDAFGQPVRDPVALQDIAMGMAAKHNANIGFGGTSYMDPGSLHIDTMPVGPGGFPGGKQWGDLPSGLAGNLNFARETGIGPTPYSGAPTPFSRDQPNPNSLRAGSVNATPAAEAYSQAAQTMGQAGVRGVGAAQQLSAPVEKVSRAPLGPASLPPDRPMPSGPMAMANLGSLPPDRPMPSGPVTPSAPSTAELAAAYGQMANTMGQVGVQGVGSTFGSIALGAPPATPAVAPMTPVQAPMQAPVYQPVNPPVAPPVRAPVHAPVQTTERLAPVMAHTPGDIYGGMVGSAMATGGNTVSRDALGRTSVTNKHGVTTVSMPDGKQAATTSIGMPETSGPSSLFGGANIGGMVKGGLGAMAGAQLGSALGPIGMALGGFVGSQLAQGKNPLSVFTGNTTTGTGKGLGYFPSAPKGNKVSPSFSNRSQEGMRGISPAAADAIGRGQAGLY